MNADKPSDTAPVPSRRSRWPYWVFVPIFAVTYTIYCTWFMLEAWGRRGEPKPAWFDVAFVFACPGMFFAPVPVVGPLMVGTGAGFVFVWLARKLLRSRLSYPPHTPDI